MQNETTRNRILTAENARAFLFAGNATFTIKSTRTGKHLTYKVRTSRSDLKQQGPHFVSLLTGPDNYSNYTYIGTVFSRENFRITRKSTCSSSAPGFKAFQWLLVHLLANELPDVVEFWHEGKCCKCARKLTDPKSIELGIGPVCRGGK